MGDSEIILIRGEEVKADYAVVDQNMYEMWKAHHRGRIAESLLIFEPQLLK
jgi:hypothetical protein